MRTFYLDKQHGVSSLQWRVKQNRRHTLPVKQLVLFSIEALYKNLEPPFFQMEALYKKIEPPFFQIEPPLA